MKLKRDDMVMVMAGRDKGKTGKVLTVLPARGMVVVEGLNIAKRHTKPSDKNPRGGILEITKPIDVSKLAVIDPESKLPARIGYTVNADGTKERVYKVSPQRIAAAKAKKAKADKAKADKADASEAKAEQPKAKPAAKPAAKAAKTEGDAK